MHRLLQLSTFKRSIAVMAFLFDLKDLVDLMSIGTLLAYTLVAACVLVLRYQPEQPNQAYQMASTQDESELSESLGASSISMLPGEERRLSTRNLLFPENIEPSILSGFSVNICASALGILILIFSILAVQAGAAPWNVAVLSILAMACLGLTIIIWRQPESKTKLSFKVPLVPFVPVISMFVNVYLMMQLDRGTWIRFAVWMAIGFVIYFGYGFRHSTEAALARSEVDLNGYKPACTLNGDSISPEKEAFFSDERDAAEEEDGDL
ncbi:hypothetical protein GJAV_G00130000 [Gymnothorax javanicus]|nr:hypothetical protein GJAV_G00130000 [Gymnothorax javanicus]